MYYFCGLFYCTNYCVEANENHRVMDTFGIKLNSNFFKKNFSKPSLISRVLDVKINELRSSIHITLQTHHVYSTLKRPGNDRFHVVPT